jgi:hypothetical protein
MASAWSVQLLSIAAGTLVACAGPRTSAPADVPAAASTPAPYRWASAPLHPIRVIPVDHGGEPQRCRTNHDEHPCDIEATANGQVFYRIDGGSITTTFPASSEVPPLVVARIEPAPPDDAAKALALFLYAMAVVENETRVHTTPDPE